MRVSSGTYYGYTGRFRDNKGKKNGTKLSSVPMIKDPVPARKYSECSCTKMILVVNGIFVDHEDTMNLPCNGSGETKDFWKY